MKVMLRYNHAGHLVVYVPKKDLEEEVVQQIDSDTGKIFTLANGWELAFPNVPDLLLKLPQTYEAKKLS
jgi:nitrogen fixation protein NifT